MFPLDTFFFKNSDKKYKLHQNWSLEILYIAHSSKQNEGMIVALKMLMSPSLLFPLTQQIGHMNA